MILSTLQDWIALLALEAIILAGLGYFNCYIPKEQLREAKNYDFDADDQEGCVVEVYTIVSLEACAFMAIVVSVVTWVLLVFNNSDEIAQIFGMHSIIGVILTIGLIGIGFTFTTFVFALLPACGGLYSFEEIRKQWNNTGVTVEDKL